MEDYRRFELYIHIPFCAKKCLYCDFLSGVFDTDTQRDYVNALCNELKFYSEKVFGTVSSIYIGGGTPSWINPDLIVLIMQTVKENFKVDPLAEISIEANPGTVVAEAANTYLSVGINRISLGLQSANDDELEELGRIHTFKRFLSTYEILRKAGFKNINVDLMSALPGQTPEKLLYTLNKVTSFRPEHISCYSLIIEPGTPFYEKYHEDAVRQERGEETKFLPNEDQAYELMKRSQMYLEKKGYHRYEISNYAREGKECVHNLGYWNRVPYLGVGIGAASLIPPGYLVREPEDPEETGGMGLEWRTTNIRDIYTYIEECSHLPIVPERVGYEDMATIGSIKQITRKAAMEEFMFLGMRQIAGIKKSYFKKSFGVAIEKIYGHEMTELEREGLLTEKGDTVALTDTGLDISNYALAKFIK
ncbi:MAG: radical SAM protein [Lachnospiraceae bacterium]|uniref:Heme chaperone HemW n=1 Tax=Candidatus Weimeria bifida TaxID=2599074 RepID=A0A6N7J0V2_9FIRM|nr:radical SAM family heme chaperone HemW [Candidatus Weimeria bifida]RRF97030.1 MAG: radical SAM protein [Lachnospiraceae bacterium]